MSYLVFARKFRPQTFEDVVQQTHVTRTLANAINAGRLAHAILFSGPRGTGKTTIARILAKAVNCANGPASTPCNVCRSCKEITSGTTVDVFEIDGASNNSVDQIRELRENLKYMPVHCRRKIYIIDEVHMLSLAAFNALLKTLEEPPEHVQFIFATTEAHKIPITILSRCQRHDLRRIGAAYIAEHLGRICEKENVSIDADSLALIAQEGGGSMRDSLSLLDHILACADAPITVQLITDLLGIVDRKHLFDLSAAVFNRDIKAVLHHIDQVWRQGLEIKRYYADIVSYFHNLTLIKLNFRTDRLVDLPEHEAEQMKRQIVDVAESHLIQVFDFLFEAESAVKFSSQPKYALEMVFLKLFQAPPSLAIDTLIEKLDQFRENAPGIISSTGGGQNAASLTVAGQKPLAVAPAAADRKDKSLEQQQTVSQDLAPMAGSGEKPANAAFDIYAADHKPVENQGQAQPVKKRQLDPAVENSSESVAGQGAVSARLDEKTLWRRLLNKAEEIKPSLAAHLTKCRVKSYTDQKLSVEVTGNAFCINNIKKNTSLIEKICSQEAQCTVRFELVCRMEDVAKKNNEKNKTIQSKQKAYSHPMVMQVVELFKGQVVDVKTS